MSRRRKKGGKISESYVLLAVLAATLLFRAYKADAPIGGYHGWNEAWYTLKALDVLNDPVRHLRGNIFMGPTPAYEYILALAFLAFGKTVFVGRMLDIVLGILSLALLHILASELYGKRAGVVAAALAAFAPAHVLVGRNIQTDMAAACFMLVFAVAYVRWLKTKDVRLLYAACLAAGVGFWFKQTTLIMVAVAALYETIKSKGVGWFGRRQLTGYAIICGLVAPYPLLGILTNPEYFVGGTGEMLQNYRRSVSDPVITMSEVFWGLSPLFAMSLAAGTYAVFKKPAKEEMFILSWGCLSLLFFAVFNYHSYYMLPLVFPAAVVSSKVLWKRNVLTAIVVLTAAFNSMLVLGVQKIGYDGLSELPAKAGDTKDTQIVISERVSGSYGEVIRYYLPNAQVKVEKKLAGLTPPKGARVLLLATEAPAEDRGEMTEYALMMHPYGISFGTFTVYMRPTNIHFFTPDSFYTATNPRLSAGPQRLSDVAEFYLLPPA